ncbi:MAG: hypothetical protein KGJ62_03550 [Armatimonadetes bacterium]|nr:hypothetical protein [Armatimonadota bacterium]MDE2206077.1 hypothetical protein [Armatimonadota bacterium]
MEPSVPTTTPRQAELQAALEALSSNRKEVRAPANLVVESLGPDDVEAVLAIIGDRRTRRKQFRRAIQERILNALPLIALLLLVSRISHLRMYTGLPIVVPTLVIGAAVVGVFGSLLVPTYGERLMLRVLGASRDRRIVGPMADALRHKDKECTALAHHSLVSLLPTLRNSDRAMLNAAQRALLNNQLSTTARQHPDLALAILAAWSQIGDETCIPAVEKLAGAGPRERIPRQVVARAQDILPLLRVAARNRNAPNELLRSAGATTGNGATMLRASPAPSAENELLLPATADAPNPAQTPA